MKNEINDEAKAYQIRLLSQLSCFKSSLQSLTVQTTFALGKWGPRSSNASCTARGVCIHWRGSLIIWVKRRDSCWGHYCGCIACEGTWQLHLLCLSQGLYAGRFSHQWIIDTVSWPECTVAKWYDMAVSVLESIWGMLSCIVKPYSQAGSRLYPLLKTLLRWMWHPSVVWCLNFEGQRDCLSLWAYLP